MRTVRAIAASVVVAWLGLTAWGYVHARQHAYAQVQLAGSALPATPEGVALPAAQLEFLDARGATIGRATRTLGLWRVVHPDAAIGDCTLQEGRGGDAWTACNDALSRETARWIGKVHSARLDDGACVHPAVPVASAADRPDLFGWWFPLQHGAGLPAPWIQLQVPMAASACLAAPAT